MTTTKQMIKNIEDKFKKCFELAVQGETLAFPNPNVACLIYFQEKLIARGIHQEFGKAHAEVIAITEAKEFFKADDRFKVFSDFAAECELILNLEPCSHYGNTPPCTSLIIESGFKKIGFAAYDTNPKVYKQSLNKFSDKSFEITKPEDLNKEIQEEALYINRTFFSIKQKEADNKLAVYLSLKIASYPNGDMITKEKDQWITGKESRTDVHRLRSTNQVLITTSSTLKADTPKYNVRHEGSELNLLSTRDPDICVIHNKEKIELEKIDSERKVIYEQLNSLDKESLEAIVRKLAFQGYQKIMIEAGPKLSKAFLESGLVDEFICYQPKENRSIEDFKSDLVKEFKLDSGKGEAFCKSYNNDYKFNLTLNKVLNH